MEDIAVSVLEDVLVSAVGSTDSVLYIMDQNYSMVAASETGVTVNASTGTQYLATECPNDLIATSAVVLATRGLSSSLDRVTIFDGYGIEAVQRSSFRGMELPMPWIFVVVQLLDWYTHSPGSDPHCPSIPTPACNAQ